MAKPRYLVSDTQRQRAKSLRQSMPRAERLLWRYLKAHHLDGLGFRRQVPMGVHIADFVCHAARLVIELDGETHDFEARQRYDRKRDALLAGRGYVVLHIPNDEVLRNLEGTVEFIRSTAHERLSLPPPPPSLPRTRGREQRGARLSLILQPRCLMNISAPILSSQSQRP